MITKEQWRTFIDHPIVEWTIFVIGLLRLLLRRRARGREAAAAQDNVEQGGTN